MISFLSEDHCKANARVWHRLARDLAAGDVAQCKRSYVAEVMHSRWLDAAKAGGVALAERPRLETARFALKHLGAF